MDDLKEDFLMGAEHGACEEVRASVRAENVHCRGGSGEDNGSFHPVVVLVLLGDNPIRIEFQDHLMRAKARLPEHFKWRALASGDRRDRYISHKNVAYAGDTVDEPSLGGSRRYLTEIDCKRSDQNRPTLRQVGVIHGN